MDGLVVDLGGWWLTWVVWWLIWVVWWLAWVVGG